MNSVLAPALEQVLARDSEVAAATARELIEALPNAVIIDRIVDADALIRLLTARLSADPLGTLEHLGVLQPKAKAKAKASKAEPAPKAVVKSKKAGRVSLTTAEVEAIKATAIKALKGNSLSRAQLVEATKIPSEAIWVRVINELISSRTVKRTGTRRTALYSLRK
jgi:hypothetical protein